MKDLDQVAIRVSEEQAKARVAIDVLKVVNHTEGKYQDQLYTLATEFLIGYFGGVVNHEEDEL